MMGKGKSIVLCTTLALVLSAAACGAETAIVLPRPGQVGLSLGGGFGGLASSGNVGGTFGNGPTLAIRGRYRMRYERAFGLSFESQWLDAREAAPEVVVGVDSTVAPTRLSLITSGVELYQMFGTRTRTIRMVMVGAGLAQMRAQLNDASTELVGKNSGDGLYVSAGAGVERFFYRSWAFDFSSRYLAIFRDGKPNHDLQVAAGMIFYASY